MEITRTEMQAIYDAGRTAGLIDAAAIARDIERREKELHQNSTANLPEANQIFINGARRAAEHIDAAADQELIGAPAELSRYAPAGTNATASEVPVENTDAFTAMLAKLRM
jgi:hypothetical protein